MNDGCFVNDKPDQYDYAQIEIQAIQSAIFLAGYDKEALDFYISKVTERIGMLQANRDMGDGLKRLR